MKNIVDKHAHVKTMRVRDRDVLYMTTKWKNAVRVEHFHLALTDLQYSISFSLSLMFAL